MTAGPVVFSWQDLFLFLLPQQLIAFALHASKNPILIPTISPTNSPEDPIFYERYRTICVIGAIGDEGQYGQDRVRPGSRSVRYRIGVMCRNRDLGFIHRLWQLGPRDAA